MNESQEFKGTYLTRRTSKESVETSVWIPSTPQQYQTTFYQNLSNDSTLKPNPINQTYKSEIIINKTPTTSVDDDVLLYCDKCKCLIDIKNETEISFNKHYYHKNCFKCSICQTNLNGSLNNRFKLNDNGEPICSKCELEQTKNCFTCHKPIIQGETIIFDKNEYHQNCFNCGQCTKSLIGQTNLRLYNSKPCCLQCFQQYFAARCEKCFQPILIGKSTTFDGKKYHSDCFRCEQCNEIINNSEVLKYNSKPCCDQCYNKYFAQKCSRCLKIISNEKSTNFDGKQYHLDCFRCGQCNEIINDFKLYTKDGKPCCIQCFNKYLAPQCDKCFQPISNENPTTFDGKYYHSSCFRCEQCNEIINDLKFHTKNDKHYCIQCYNKYLAPQCEKCFQPILNGKSTNFDGKEYHLDCFRCGQCNEIINDLKFHTKNGKPCCIQCFNKYFASQCSRCLKVISNGKSINFDGKEYHSDCFRCNRCDKIIVEKEIPTHNTKPYCIQCYEQYLAPRCEKCFRPISNGKSIIYSEKKYHPDCFRCGQCNEIINDQKFHTQNNKPCCTRCFNRHFAPQCAQCLNIISVGKSVIVDGKNYHPDCFRCIKCNETINDSKFHTQDGKPCCIPCFNRYFAPQCAQCLNKITIGKSVIADGKSYHSDCFRCDQCKKVLNNSKFDIYNCKPCCIECYNQYSSVRCEKCFKPIIDRYTTFQEKKFHIQCFVCEKCHRVIQGSEKFSNGDLGILCLTCNI